MKLKNELLLLKGIGWASIMGISMAYQWSRPIPLQLKIIHSRIYAQVRMMGVCFGIEVI